MRLHENDKLFRQSVQYTAQQRGIKDIYIEKDYWVIFALYTVFNSEASAYAVFKGGTSLSKCFGIIERFSEDIDMVVLKMEGDSGNRLKAKLKNLSNALEHVLPEIEVKGITNKKGMIRKTAHTYNRLFDGNYGQVRDFLVLESTWLSGHEPFTEVEVSSYIYQMMVESGQEEIADKYNLQPFAIRVLEPIRTICEKIMSLVRFSNSENPIDNLKLKIRHLYDLHQLLAINDLAVFLNSTEFETMLLNVAEDDVKGHRSGNEWLTFHPKEAALFKESEATWNKIKGTYSGSFADLVYGALPMEDEILETIIRIRNRLQTIEWNILPPK